MFVRIISLLLVGFLMNVSAVSLTYGAGVKEKTSKIEKRAKEVKQGVKKLGVSKDSKVKVKLRDKRKVKGYISDIQSDGFTVTDKSGSEHFVKYVNAKQVRGNNLHAGVWVAIGVGAALIIALIIFQQFDS